MDGWCVREFVRKRNSSPFKMNIYSCAVIFACINLGNSLGSTRNQSPDEERYSFFDAELLQAYNFKENGNFLVSPISVKLVLGMLMEGVGGKAAEEIRSILRLPESEEATRKEFAGWMSLLQKKEPANVFQLANWMFASKKHPVNPEYKNILKRYYSGGVTDVTFENGKETAEMINAWVSNRTSHVLTSLLDEGQINPEDKLVLASVVYFKGLWSTPFVMEKSVTKCFYSQKDECTEARMMTETGYFDYGYISRLDAKAIVLPYQGDRFSMLFLLPVKREGIEQLGRDLIHVSLKSILSEVEQEEVFVQIPQFEITYNDDLVESLKKLHVSRVFDQNANLSKIFTGNVEATAVRRIYHSTKIIVNEDGSEGAAASAALFVPLMGGPTTSFIANHPFMFFLLDRSKNLVIFAGKVVTPKVPESLKRNTLRVKSELPKIKKENSPVVSFKVGKNQTQKAHEPTFRSIKSDFTPLQASPNANFIKNDSRSILTIYKTFANEYAEKVQTPKKRGKSAQSVTQKKPKRQEKQNDDWRRHVLVFT